MQEIIEESLCLENRKKISLTKVKSVDAFNDQMLKLTLTSDTVTILGENIKITAYNKQTENFTAEGKFFQIKYGNKKTSLLKKLVK